MTESEYDRLWLNFLAGNSVLARWAACLPDGVETCESGRARAQTSLSRTHEQQRQVQAAQVFLGCKLALHNAGTLEISGNYWSQDQS